MSFQEFYFNGKFFLPSPHITLISMIFISIYLWIVPSTNQVDSFGDTMPLSPLEKAYHEIVSALATPSESHDVLSMQLDTYSCSPWFGSWDSRDPLSEIFPTDEIIFEVMSLDETPWNDAHHHSSFLPSLIEIPSCLEAFFSHNPIHPLQTPILVHEVLSKGSMGNITTTMPIDISIKTGIVEKIHIGVSCSPYEIRIYTDLFKEFCNVFAWSYEKILGIDIVIVVHEIPTYPDAKPIHKRLYSHASQEGRCY